MSFTLGKKLGITRVFDDAGNHVTATLIQVGPCWVTQVKTESTDGYNAVQIGFGKVKEKVVNKPTMGQLKKSGLEPLRHLKEFRLNSPADYKPGDLLTADRFQVGQIVNVVGISKGRGMAGVVKKYHFGGPNATHGTHEYNRHPGAVGAHSDPGRIWKGQRMPGQMGNQRVTVKNLPIIKVESEQNLMLIKGAVPGARNSILEISLSVKSPVIKEKKEAKQKAEEATAAESKKS